MRFSHITIPVATGVGVLSFVVGWIIRTILNTSRHSLWKSFADTSRNWYFLVGAVLTTVFPLVLLMIEGFRWREKEKHRQDKNSKKSEVEDENTNQSHPKSPTYTQDFEKVLEKERKRLGKNAGKPPTLGIALSGGGIRSASFCLGALTALHNAKILEKADFLSSVSGGGYTATSLMAHYNESGNFGEALKTVKDKMKNQCSYLTRTGFTDAIIAVLTSIFSNFLPATIYCLLLGKFASFASGVPLVEAIISQDTDKLVGGLVRILSYVTVAFLVCILVGHRIAILKSKSSVMDLLDKTLRENENGIGTSAKLLLAFVQCMCLYVTMTIMAFLWGTVKEMDTLLEITGLGYLINFAIGGEGVLVSMARNVLTIVLSAVIALIPLMIGSKFMLWHASHHLVSCNEDHLCLKNAKDFEILAIDPDLLVVVAMAVLVVTFIGYEKTIRTMNEFYETKLKNAFYPKNSALTTASLKKGPILLVNCALNNYNKKVSSFVFSPVYTGGDEVGWKKTKQYGDNDSRLLSQTMAISGAAVAIDMGNSVPSFSLLKASIWLMGLGLGVWYDSPTIGNMEREHAMRQFHKCLVWASITVPYLAAAICEYFGKPEVAMVCLIFAVIAPLVFLVLGEFIPDVKVMYWSTPIRGLAQILQLKSNDMPRVYLSDGGHFENLGVFELIRRNCKHIVSFDAGEDPNWQLEDLYNLLAAAVTHDSKRGWYCDFVFQDPTGKNNENLETNLLGVLNKAKIKDLIKTNQRMLKLQYKKIGNEGNTICEGYIWFVKATLTGDEKAHLQLFSLQQPSFPHHSTPNQLFTSSQFQAYFDLGEHSAKRLCELLAAEMTAVSDKKND